MSRDLKDQFRKETNKEPMRLPYQAVPSVTIDYTEWLEDKLTTNSVNEPLIADLERQLINATNNILERGVIGDSWTRLNNKIERLSSTLNVLNRR